MGLRDNGWVPTNIREAMVFEHQMYPEEINDPSRTARRLLNEALPYAAMELRNIALNELDPKTRLTAIQVILDRTQGKAGINPTTGANSPAEELFESLHNEIEQLLRAG